MGEDGVKGQPVGELQASSPGVAAQIFGRGIYHDVPTLVEAVAKLQTNYNVLAPIVRPDIIPPLHAIAVRQVSIDARVAADGRVLGHDFYFDKGVYRLTRIGLNKIASAMGISWHPIHTCRVDDRSQPYYCEFRAVGLIKHLDGTERTVAATRSMDVRNGAPHGYKPNELAQVRKFLVAHCEARAKNRVIREAALIKSAYKLEEIKRPFVVVTLTFTGQTDDPELQREVNRALALRAVGATSNLFGPIQSIDEGAPAPTTPPPSGFDFDVDDDEIEAREDSTEESPSQPNDDKSRFREITKIKDIAEEKGVRHDGKPWRLWRIVTEEGDTFSTFSATLGAKAIDARAEGADVAIEGEFDSEHGWKLVGIATISG